MSVFSKIIAGELPGRFVWADDVCVAFATIEPVQPGHILIVPREETDNYIDVDPNVFSRIAHVAQIIGKAQMLAFDITRPVMSILGFDVPHCHGEQAVRDGLCGTVADSELDDAMNRVRSALCELGYKANVPPHMYSCSL